MNRSTGARATLFSTLGFLSVLFWVPDCTPSTVKPAPDADAAPLPPGPPSSPCLAACAAAKAVGCPEGQFSDCASTCTLEISDPGMPHPNTACLSTASSPAGVRSCGWACKLDGG